MNSLNLEDILLAEPVVNQEVREQSDRLELEHIKVLQQLLQMDFHD